MSARRRILWLALGVAVAYPAAAANPPAGATPKPSYVAIIIDDLGNSLNHGERVIRLPAPIACAILPHTAFAARLAHAAVRTGKEVLLHLPMESLDRNAAAGPGALEAAMPPREQAAMLDYDFSTVPHAVGVSNHMGSRLTQDERAMHELMQALRRRGNVFFVDSRTSPKSVALSAARRYGVPALVRDVFLDNDPSPDAINARLAELLIAARRYGAAIAIGHPHPNTLAALEQWLPTLDSEGVVVVTLAEMLKQRERARAARLDARNRKKLSR